MTAEAVQVRYEPRGAAKRLFSTRDSEVLLDGPAGTGKSLAALYRLHIACLKHKGIRCLIVRKTQKSLTSTTLSTFEETVVPEAMAAGIVRWYGGSERRPPAYQYKNGSEIRVGGMDKPEKVLSSEYDLIFVDEATELTETDWETLQTRLRHGKLPWQQAIAATNPAQPAHWMNRRPTVTRLLSRHGDNPRYTNADGSLTPEGVEYMAKLDALTGVRKLRLKDGIWAAAEGLIYEDYDPAIHLIDRFEIPLDWPRYWAIDFGFTNPFVLQWWAEDPDGRLYLYREIYMTRRTVDEHCATVAGIVLDDAEKPADEPWRGTWREPMPDAIVGDHDAEGRATFTQELGLTVKAADKRVSEGIQAVQRRVRVAEDKKPRIYLMRDAVVEIDRHLRESNRPVGTEEEFVSYIWKIKPGGDETEEPVKKDDHGMDTTRYLVMDRDQAPDYNVRWL